MCGQCTAEAKVQRIAIPIAGTRISPLFDVARTLLLVDIENGKVTNRSQHEIRTNFPPARARLLADLGVTELLCGGISRPVATIVESGGVRLIPWIAGEVEDVLASYVAGQLPNQRFLMPGCGKARRSRRGRRGGFGCCNGQGGPGRWF